MTDIKEGTSLKEEVDLKGAGVYFGRHGVLPPALMELHVVTLSFDDVLVLLSAARDEAFRLFQTDLDTISERANREAVEREWCEAYDQIVSDIADDLVCGTLKLRRITRTFIAEVEVEVTGPGEAVSEAKRLLTAPLQSSDLDTSLNEYTGLECVTRVIGIRSPEEE